MLTNKTWIYGWHLCDRWRYLPVQLAEVWRAGLPVHRVHDLAVQVPGQSCLECTCATAEGLPGCSDPDVCNLDYPQYGYDSNGREVEYTFQIDDGQVGVRLFSYNYVFDLSEVQAFEQAHGLAIWTPEAQDQGARIAPCYEIEKHSADQHVQETLPDSPEEYVQQLKSKKLDDAEIKYRLYHNGKKSWKVTWWKAHYIVEGLTYPKRGSYERIQYKDDCLRQVNAWLKLKETPKTPNSTPKTPKP